MDVEKIKDRGSISRKIWAFIAFNLYSIQIIGAFKESTPFILDGTKWEQARNLGILMHPSEWGWQDHYVYRLIAAVITTIAVGILTGAIARTKGGLTTLIANIPSVVIWLFAAVVIIYKKPEIVASVGFMVISIIAIPVTTYLAYQAGKVGEDMQSDFADNTIFGIRPYHWVWLFFPIYWYSKSIIFAVSKFIGFQSATFGDTNFIVNLFSIILLFCVLLFIYPMKLVYKVLRGEVLNEKNSFIKASANTGIIIAGLIVPSLVLFSVLWVLEKLHNYFS